MVITESEDDDNHEPPAKSINAALPTIENSNRDNSDEKLQSISMQSQKKSRVFLDSDDDDVDPGKLVAKSTASIVSVKCQQITEDENSVADDDVDFAKVDYMMLTALTTQRLTVMRMMTIKLPTTTRVKKRRQKFLVVLLKPYHTVQFSGSL